MAQAEWEVEVNQAIGNRVWLARFEAGLSQPELARKTEMTEGAVSQLERGLRYPRQPTVGKLAEATNKDPRFFLLLVPLTKKQRRTLEEYGRTLTTADIGYFPLTTYDLPIHLLSTTNERRNDNPWHVVFAEPVRIGG